MRNLTVMLLFCVAALAQSSDAPWRRMLDSKRQVTEYLNAEAQRLTAGAAAEVRSRGDWEKVRAQRLEEMRDMLGLRPWPQRTPLNVRSTGTLDKGAYTIEKIAFESMPRIYVTGNLYVPKKRGGRVPAIVYVCGHSFSPYGDKTQYQRHGISLAKNGYVAFILDSIQIAETFALHHGVSAQEMYDWYARGYTPAGVEVWNAMRAIDYLETRPEVDASRIGMTGRSGGAAMSWFTAAVDPRVKVVAPVMGISTYAANLKENTQRLHCDCMFPVNSHRHDMMHQGALIAPRPLLMAHGREDALFPVAGYREFTERIGGLYRSYGKRNDFVNLEVHGAHKDSDLLREQVIRWFDRHLLNVAGRKLDMDYSDAPPEELAVFGGHPPADAQNYRVHEDFTTAPAAAVPKDAAAWQARSAALLGRIRAMLPAPAQPAQLRRTGGESGHDSFELETDPAVSVRVLVRRPRQAEGKLPAVLYVASDGEDPQAVFSLLSNVSRRRSAVIMAVYPRGVGEVPWDKTFWKATLRNAMHVGQTVDSMRLKDVLAAAAALRAQPGVDPARLLVLGKGVAGAIGLYAAILDAGIAQVMLIDPPASHREGPVFLDIMRHTDLPEAAALLAPRRLNFYGHMPPAYEYTRKVYQLAGKPEHVFVAMNIEGVAEGRYDHNYSSGL
ncbi:MAG: acetylxylan esterase [Acidobacteria bacterium]|nr:acetylxylan esterase [Acidobacteriota bacterium]